MCVDLSERPELFDTALLWLHAEWLKQRKDRKVNPAEAYAKRRVQLQAHLSADAVPSTFIAIESNRALGCVSLTRLPFKRQVAAKALWVSNLFVTPTARGQGVAGALLSHIERHAQVLGEKSLFLYTTSASRYYLDKGWERCIQRTPVADEEGVRPIVLKKKL